MSVISVRVSSDEQLILENASKVYGCGVSSMIKKIVFERLEDEYDLQLIEEYESAKANKEIKTRSINDLFKELEL